MGYQAPLTHRGNGVVFPLRWRGAPKGWGGLFPPVRMILAFPLSPQPPRQAAPDTPPVEGNGVVFPLPRGGWGLANFPNTHQIPPCALGGAVLHDFNIVGGHVLHLAAADGLVKALIFRIGHVLFDVIKGT